MEEGWKCRKCKKGGLLPISRFVSRQSSVATKFFLALCRGNGLCRDRIWARLVFLGRDKEFLVAIEPPGSMLRQGFPRAIT